MDTANIPNAFKNGIGTFEAFRKLGFVPDDIHWHMNPDGQMFCVLRTQGKQFGVSVGYVQMSGRDWEAEFQKLTTDINEHRIDEETLQSWYTGCEAYRRKSDFLVALLGKGIVVPKTAN